MKPVILSLALAAALVPPAGADDVIPKITTLDGTTYAEVKLIRREGDSVRIMHAHGIKTLKLSGLDRASAVALGAVQYEKEAAAKEIAAAQKMELEKQEALAQEEAKSRFLDAARRKKTKDLNDWVALALTEGALELGTMKKVVGRPPDFQSGNSYFWKSACWNYETEKLDDLVLSTTRIINTLNGEAIILKGELMMIDAPTLKSGSRSFVSSRDTDTAFKRVMVEKGMNMPGSPK